MSQMQQSNGADYFTTIRGLTSPLGTDLSDSSLQSLYPYLGNIALDKTRGSIFYGANNVWNGLVTGPVGPVTDGSIVIFDGTTGQFIEDTGITITNGTELNGVTLINGQPPPVGTNTGDVVMTTFGAAPNANAATITALPGPAFGQQLQLQPASATFPGGVSTGSQAFAGLKDFSANGIRLQPSPITLGVVTTLNNYAKYDATLSWTGGINPGVANYPYTIELIGKTIVLGLLDILNPGTQAGATIISTAPVPVEFRPSADRMASGWVISSTAGTAGNGFAPGFFYLRASGLIEVGLSITNAGVLNPFSGVGASGNGNGFFAQELVFTV